MLKGSSSAAPIHKTHSNITSTVYHGISKGTLVKRDRNTLIYRYAAEEQSLNLYSKTMNHKYNNTKHATEDTVQSSQAANGTTKL
jgi:hypothetical protein